MNRNREEAGNLVMASIPIEQAIYGNFDQGGYRFLARSPGFGDEWLSDAERLCAAFGNRPAGAVCPSCIFAQPFGDKHVVVVQAADQGNDDAGRPGALAFYLLVFPRLAYEELVGDPFLIAEHFPASWQARGELPALSWPRESPPYRTVEQVRDVIRSPNSAALLGGAQALVDGSRVVFQRPAPDNDLLRNLWFLLPASTRCRLWPASFAFDNSLGFDALVVPRAEGPAYAGYLTEQQAGDYPEGRYELSLQTAAESGNQRDLDILFSRRSSGQTLKMAVVLLVAVTALAAVMQMVNAPRSHPPTRRSTAHAVSEKPPLPDEYPSLPGPMRIRLAEALTQLLGELQTPPASARPTVEQLLGAVDNRLGSPDPRRAPGPLKNQGNAERQLRVLLWKHHVAEYADPKLNPVELVERLRAKVVSHG